ncbi:MAG TPA: YvcK family protein [Candidatus Omnitrophota bacterium]|nr:YvcK family protein [Candidatus Omnitrophota bacterium]HRZ14998.1 YvcK family protein [Candidatus Omnitrophota bacterium]
MIERVTRIIKWLYPGIGIKRWMGLSAFGVILLVIGSSGLQSQQFLVIRILDAVILLSGLIILILGIKRLMRAFIQAVIPSTRENELVDILYQRKQLARGPKIVAIGGGTGLSMLLTGLKEYTSNISAIVTVADDGGSSGRLRQQFDILPPGDIRNCLVALADASTMMRELFQFRFDSGSELAGHSFGNLFITVMTRITGDFEKAIRETSKVLALRGQVIPSALSNVVLAARYRDGSVTEGENKIPLAHKQIERVFLKPETPEATPEAVKAIDEADIIVLGPGSLYTSIMPNLLIKEIRDALYATKAIKVYVCNVMTQPGETDGYPASRHLKAILEHSHERVVDYCIVNTGSIPQEMLNRYVQEQAFQVVNDRRKIEKMGFRVIEDDTISTDNFIRHDPMKLAKIILGFLDEV